MAVALTATQVTVSGQDRRGEQFELRLYEADLAQICTTGWGLRQDLLGSIVGCWAARLRALGVALTQEEIEPLTLTSEHLRLDLTGRTGDQLIHRSYFLPDLSTQDGDCRRQRVVQPLRRRAADPADRHPVLRWDWAGGA
jgi:hypothetical protein